MNRLLVFLLVLAAIAGMAPPSGHAQSEPIVGFTFANGTTAEDEALIRVGVAFAAEFFAETFGVTVDGPIAVDVRGTQQYDVIAHTAPGEIYIATGAMGWHYAPPLRKLQTVIHEYVHLLHWQVDPAGTMPLWLVEGSAEYLAWYAIDQLGLLELAIAQDFWIGSTLTNPGLQGVALSALERPGLSAAGSIYEIGAFAVSQLVAMAGVDALFSYFPADSAVARPDAFVLAFGVDLASFYGGFEALRATARPSGFDVTPLLFPWYPSPDPADVAELRGWEAVTPGGFSLVQARSAAGAVCTLRFVDPNGQQIREETMRANSDGSVFWFWRLDQLTVTGRAQATVTCGQNTLTTEIAIG